MARFKQILLNNQHFQVTASMLPCLIHGQEHDGASLFTISLVAQLYKQRNKLLALTGYPMAREEFAQQVEEPKTNFSSQDTAIFITQNEEAVFIEYIK